MRETNRSGKPSSTTYPFGAFDSAVVGRSLNVLS
jgi:hypothetical protein